MATNPFGSGFGGGFGSGFGNGFGSQSPSTTDEVFNKQMATMLQTLQKAGVNPQPVDQSTWLEKLFKILNVPLGVTTSLASGFVKPGSNPGEGARQALDVIQGKKTYGTTELLNETLGKDDSLGRKIAAFALGVPMDPLTWIPLSKVAKPLLKGSEAGLKAVGLGKQVDAVGDVASGIKKFFGYDDFRRFAAKPAEMGMRIVDGKAVPFERVAAQPDLREAARTITQLTGSGTARRGMYIDDYMKQLGETVKQLKFNKEESNQFLRAIEKSNTKEFQLKAGEVLSPKVQSAVDSFREAMKNLGNEKASRGLIEDVSGAFTKAGLPKRIGGASSEGYVPHIINPEFMKKYPTLSAVPEELQSVAKPFYEIGSKKIYARKLPGSILDSNLVSMSTTGMKMFEDDPLKIMLKEIENMSHIKSQQDIVKAIKGLKDAAGNPIIQSFDDKTIEALGKKIAVVKDASGKQPFAKFAGTQMEDFLKKVAELTGQNYDETIKNLPKGMGALTNPLFKEGGKVTAANSEIASIINKLSETVPADETNSLLRGFDKITSLWKKLAITNPKFHVNNFIGATSNNLIDDMAGTIKNAPLVEKILKGGGDEVITLANGVKGTPDELMKMFRESGATAGFIKAEAASKNPAKIVQALSGSVGGKIEERARLAAFVNGMQRGLSPSEALQRVFQIHGNYAPEAMSNFEKNVIKRIIPFYTWAKTSAPYQASQLYNKTGIYSNLAHANDIALKGVDRSTIPDWLRGNFLISSTPTEDGKASARQLPLSAPDLEMLQNPLNVLMSKLNPMLKVPIELGINRNTFFDTPIVNKNKFTDQGKKVSDLKQIIDYLNAQNPALTAIKGVGKNATNEMENLGLEKNTINTIMAAIAGQIDPTNPKTYDPAREKYAQDKVTSEMMQSLISQLRRSGVIPPAKR